VLPLVVSALALALTTTAVPTATPKPTASITATPTSAPAKASPTPTTVPVTPTPQPTLRPTPPPPPTPAPVSLLPATQPGLGRDEGVFLVTDADDGGQAAYFIAQGSRHSILESDLQRELAINPLWPYRAASRDETLALPEGAPIGGARTGRVGGGSVATSAQPEAATLMQSEPATAAHPAADVSLGATPASAAQPAPATETASQASTPPAVATHSEPPAAGGPGALAAQAEPLGEPAVVSAPLAESAVEPTLTASPSLPITIQIRPGDNLTVLSRVYHTSVQDLLQANGISDPNHIYAGQTLVIPAVPETPPIAQTVVSDADAPDQTQALTYTVQHGDTLSGIAARFGLKVDQLLANNGITNRNRINAGQTLSLA
jgi:LysM repeat protein